MIAVFLKTLAALVGPLTIALCVLAGVRSRRALQNDLEASLSQCRFDTPDGPVTGDALRVVKRSVQVTRSPGNSPSELFWYCVGPGPRYVLAIAHVRRHWRRTEIRWTLRTLTEERLRGALVGDRTALAAAFGDAPQR